VAKNTVITPSNFPEPYVEFFEIIDKMSSLDVCSDICTPPLTIGWGGVMTTHIEG